MPPGGQSQVDDPDRFLVGQIRSGDPRAWKQLIDRYQGRLSAFARSRLRGHAEAEDVLQETFLGFVTSLKHFDDSRSLETYLFAILRHKIGELLTRRKRPADAAIGFDISDEGESIDPAVAETPSRVAVAQERTRNQEELLAAILRRLIDELRERGKLDDVHVIELLFYVGLRNKEAGDRLGRDEKSIAGVKFRALSRLREFVDETRAARGPEAVLDDSSLSDEATISGVWRSHRLSCLKRSTIGAYLLGVLEEPWQEYTRLHLESIRCLMCRANMDDLRTTESEPVPPEVQERIFQSSVGFLSRGK